MSEQSQIYEESWKAASAQVKAALEDVYDTLLDDEAIKSVLRGIAQATTAFGDFLDAIGGLPGALSLVGAVVTKVFSEQLAGALTTTKDSIFQITGLSKKEYDILRNDFVKQSQELINKTNGGKNGSGKDLIGDAWSQTMTRRVQIQDKFAQSADKMTQSQVEMFNILNRQNQKYSDSYNQAAQDLTKLSIEVDNLNRTFLTTDTRKTKNGEQTYTKWSDSARRYLFNDQNINNADYANSIITLFNEFNNADSLKKRIDNVNSGLETLNNLSKDSSQVRDYTNVLKDIQKQFITYDSSRRRIDLDGSKTSGLDTIIKSLKTGNV